LVPDLLDAVGERLDQFQLVLLREGLALLLLHQQQDLVSEVNPLDHLDVEQVLELQVLAKVLVEQSDEVVEDAGDLINHFIGLGEVLVELVDVVEAYYQDDHNDDKVDRKVCHDHRGQVVRVFLHEEVQLRKH